jgi:hypothetical protein
MIILQNAYNLLHNLAESEVTKTDPKEVNTSPNGNHVTEDSYSSVIQHFKYEYISIHASYIGLLC